MPVIISIVGTSDSGKTVLLEGLIPEIRKRGYRVGVIKHSVHGFNLDHEGKDSWRHKQAGAQAVTLSSPTHVAMIREVERELTIDEIVSNYLGDMDIILTEGYKKEGKPKIEIFRKDGPHKDILCKDDKNLIAVVTDKEMEINVPCLGLQDIVQLVDFLEKNYLTVKTKQKGNKVQKEDNLC
jgi:molybdopterin-guanine dinucleotide biosynthesis protein B